MKKILMLAMMVVTMGLVGCGEMSAEEIEKMEKEIVSMAEENGYEMIIIKKDDKKEDVEMSTFQLRGVEESITPEAEVSTEENADVAEPTPVLEVNEKYGIPTMWVEVAARAVEYAGDDTGTDASYGIYFTWDTASYGAGVYTKFLHLAKEEYDVASQYTTAKVLIPAKSDGTPILLCMSAWEIYEYEFIAE